MGKKNTRVALDIHDELTRLGADHDALLKTIHSTELEQEEYGRRVDKIDRLDARIRELRGILRGVLVNV